MRQLALACVLLLTACGGCKDEQANNDAPGPIEPWTPEDCAAEDDLDDDGFEGCADSDCRLATDCAFTPPKPSEVMDSPSRAGIASFWERTSFLFEGEPAIQRGVEDGAITETLIGAVHGVVRTPDGEPVTGAAVTVANHPEFGRTYTRADGQFDMAFDAGRNLVLRVEKPGFAAVFRNMPTLPLDTFVTEDVVLTPLHDQATVVDFESTVFVEGTTTDDDDGERRTALIIPKGRKAELIMPDGSRQRLGQATVRVTEVTVGDSGPQAMAGELPGTSQYTFAAEFTVDEAVDAGADHVEFDAPVYAYVDNFVGFEPGTAVPSGWFDRQNPAWKGAPDGVVLRIEEVSNGRARVSAGDLDQSDLGMGDDELTLLAEHYEPGDELWRVPLRHFSPWDFNWPGLFPPGLFGPPGGAWCSRADCNNRTESGSIIDCDNQTLGEMLPLNGTPLTLVYDSGRVPGRLPVLSIPLRNGELDGRVQQVDVVIDVAGVKYERSFDPEEEDVPTIYEFTWDRTDQFGRLVQGAVPAEIDVTYHFELGYNGEPVEATVAISSGLTVRRQALEEEEPGRFLQYSTSNNDTVTIGRTSATVTRHETVPLGGWDVAGERNGGWTFDLQHRFDAGVPSLHFGHGADLVSRPEHRTLRVVGGAWPDSDAVDASPPGTSADDAFLGRLGDVAVGRDGSVYYTFAPGTAVRRITPDGDVAVVAGQYAPNVFGEEERGDGGPADEAEFIYVNQLNVAPDGLLYLLTETAIWRIDEDDTIHRVAGGGEVDLGDELAGVPARELRFNAGVGTFDVAKDGAVYFPTGFGQVVRVGRDGLASTFAGKKTSRGCDGVCGDGELAPSVDFNEIKHLRVLSDDTLVIVEHISPTTDDDAHDVLRRIRTDGRVESFGDFRMEAVHDVEVHPVTDEVYVAPEGGLYLGVHVFRVAVDGALEEFVGRAIPEDQIRESVQIPIRDGWLASRQLWSKGMFTMTPRGEAVFANLYQIAAVRELLPTWTGRDYQIPSPDGEQVFQFFADGRHDKTRDAWTGTALLEFAYDDDKLLTAVIDREGDETRVVRDAAGHITSITGPEGVQWTFETDSNGYLTAVISPEDETWQLEHDDGGLLTSMTSPTSHTWAFEYDDVGRLIRDEDATLERELEGDTRNVTYTSGEGRQTQYRKDLASSLNGSETTGNVRSADAWGEDGYQRRTLPDGSSVLFRSETHPALGYTAAYPEFVGIYTPGGASFEMNATQTATLGSDNLFGLVDWREEVIAGEQSVVSSWNGALREFRVDTAGLRATTVRLDELGRAVELTPPGEARQELTYDASGRVVEVTQADRTWAIAYNDNGYAERIESPDGTVQLLRDAMGRITRGTRPDMSVVDMAWDGMSNVSSITPPEREAYTMAYNERRQPLTFAAPDSDYAFDYNADFQLTAVTYPDDRTASFAYDENARLASVDSPYREVTLAYDDGTIGDFDGTNQLLAVQSDSGVDLEFAYDGFLPTDVVWLGDVEGEVSFRYGDQLRLEAIGVNGSEVAYGYDIDGAVISAGDQTITYEPATYRVAERELGQVAVSYDYDEYGQLTSIDADTLDLQYTYDALGRVIQIVEDDQGMVRTFAYAYDPLGQLTEVRTDDVVTGSYTYDANGNRLSSLTVPNATYSGEDELLSYGTRSYTYSAGQLTSMTDGATTTTFDYAISGELRSVDDRATRVEYEHDGFGRRVGKYVDGTLIQGFLYQDALNPIAELDGTGAVRSRFVYASRGHVPDFMIQNGREYMLVTDHLGSVRHVIDTADGTITQQLEYDEFGNVLSDTNPGFQPFGFAGGLYDRDTGLVRFGVRDYDPAIGRWVAADPADFHGGQTNLFAYTWNSPLSFIDPTGLAGAAVVVFEVVAIFGVGLLLAPIANGVANALQIGGPSERRRQAYEIGYRNGTSSGVPFYGGLVSGEQTARANIEQCLVNPSDPEEYIRQSRENSFIGSGLGAVVGLAVAGAPGAVLGAAVGAAYQTGAGEIDEVTAAIKPGMRGNARQWRERSRRLQRNPHEFVNTNDP